MHRKCGKRRGHMEMKGGNKGGSVGHRVVGREESEEWSNVRFMLVVMAE